MVMQFANQGNLIEFLHENFSRLSWFDLLQLAMELAEGLEFLHRENIIHRDLVSLSRIYPQLIVIVS